MKLRSLQARLWLGTAAVLAVFVGLTGFALEQAMRDSARGARQERLQAQVYLLLAAAEVNAAGRLTLDSPLPEPRFDTPGSGLVGRIVAADGTTVWGSRSALGVELPPPTPLPPGAQGFGRVDSAQGAPHFQQSFGVSWTTGGGSHRFTVAVAEDLGPYARQLADYRRSLWGWLAALALLLLAAQALTLRWGLRPLRRIAQALARLEQGRDERLSGAHPAELQPLADNLNRVLAHERAQQARYRDALADLAHSLKTPMAVVRAELQRAAAEPALRERLDEQVRAMDRVVDYHLQRASAAARRTLAAPLALAPVVERLRSALGKVHADKALVWQVDIPADARARIDEGDLTELLGNLLDNACKWSAGRLSVSARLAAGSVSMSIEDDGPGFDTAVGRQVLERGVRADETVPGHGIGLAVAQDIVQACGGTLELGRSAALGGARVAIGLPGAGAG